MTSINQLITQAGDKMDVDRSAKKIARIEGWYFSVRNNMTHLIGVIKDHPNQDSFNAEFQITSPIVSISPKDNEVETFNTVYTLGKPSEYGNGWDDIDMGKDHD